MMETFCFLQLTTETQADPCIFLYSAQTKTSAPIKIQWKWDDKNGIWRSQKVAGRCPIG